MSQILTEKDYLKALEIVLAYKKQVNKSVAVAMANKLVILTNGMHIAFTKMSGLSKVLQLNTPYKVISSYMDMRCSKEGWSEAYETMSKDQFDQYLIKQEDARQIIILSVNGKYKQINTRAGYSYVVV